jgi:CBS domain-containing protein
MSVSHILKHKGRNVLTVTPAASVKDVIDTLAKHRIGAVVVEDGGGIAGIVSERDIVRAIADHGAKVLEKSAADIMTQHRIRHLPVVQGGKLAGMISIGDVVKFRMEAIEREAEDMKTYIASAG